MPHPEPGTTHSRSTNSRSPEPRAVAATPEHVVRTFEGASLPSLAWPAGADDATLDAYVYQSREFLAAWSATIGQARRSQLFLVRVEDGAGRPVMWLPLVVEREFGSAILRFPDGGMADYNAPILGPTFASDAAGIGRLWAAVLRTLPPVDVVDFVKMPATVWQRPNPLLNIAPTIRQDEGWYLPLTGTHADYLAHPSRKGRVRKLGQLFRKLQRSGAVEIGEVRDAEEVAAVRAFIEQHKSRQYRRTLGFSQFDRPGVRLFVDRLCEPRSLATFTRLTALRLDGSVIAAQLDFVTPRRQQGFITTFDAERHAFVSPGRQVQLHLIARAFADKLDVFDLGHGDNLYKHPWMSHALELHSLAEARSLRGRAFLAARALRRRLPERLGAAAMRLLRAQPSGAAAQAGQDGLDG